MKLQKIIRNLYCKTRNKIYSPNPNATLLLGLNKSGTSVTINLLAHRAGISFTDDPDYKIGGFNKVLNGELSLKQYTKRHSYLYSSELIRYSIKPKAVKLARSFFNMERYVVTIRNPVDNVKSILERLNLPGDLDELDTNYLDFHPDWIEMLTKKSNYIESLAHCWLDAYNQSNLLEKNKAVLFKYEDFLDDKVGYITEKVIELGYQPKNNIDHLVDIQYQPKGTNISHQDFFGSSNFDKIIKTTGALASKFGYDLNKIENTGNH